MPIGQSTSAGEFAAGELLWGASQWFLPAMAVGTVLAGLVLWSYLQAESTGPVRVFAGLLKLTAVILLAICLLEPMRSGTRPRPQANVLPILVDNSQSMRLKSANSDSTRLQRVSELVDAESAWRLRLAQAFDVRQYAFDARLESVDDLTELDAGGYVSSMAGSLRSLSERFVDRPVAGAILFTDGNLTDGGEADQDWSSLGFPIYPVLPEGEGNVQDLRIADVSIRQTDFESAPTTVNLSIDAVGMTRQKVFVQLKDITTGEVTEEQSTVLGKPGEAQEFRFRFRPKQSGVSFYVASVFTEDDRDAVTEASTSPSDRPTKEATLLNNQRILTIDRASGPYRILYVAGRPNWEFKFLRRALQEDAEVQLVGLLRIANKEPKFSFRDKGVNDTNPLFAGLGDAEEDGAEQYDEPVIIRLGVKESEELSDGFPESPEELFAYQGIILDDIESDFFTQDQLLLLRRFVSARGGGLLMLGGQESFDDQNFADTPLGELSPVYAPRATTPRPRGPFRLKLTREGLLQPWVRLRDNQNDERGRLESMPPFRTLNAVGDLKPGASQLAVVEAADETIVPAIVAQRFGKGRTAAIPIGDLWRWSMRRENRDQDDSGQAWRQIAHWLVNDVPRRADVRVEASTDPSQPVKIIATAQDESYLPLDNASVDLEITPIGGEPFTIKADADPSEAGVYSATYWSREPGGYRVRAEITGADGTRVGTASSGWTAQSGAAEFRELKLNRDLLAEIARQTGGEVVPEDELTDFANELPTRKVPVSETWVYPIWHRPWVLCLAMLCLCGEWGLRRWKGLA